MTSREPRKPIALEERGGAEDARLFSPSAGRNREVVTAALAAALPAEGRALEVGSGTGEHVIAFAAATPGLQWTPSDPDPRSRESIAAWVAHAGLANTAAPIDLDVRAPVWPVEGAEPFAAVVSLNMIHIAPWAAAEGLIAGAGRLVRPGGVLAFYGPFQRGGAHTAPSNADFDASLKSRDPSWGVRDLDDVAALAQAAGFDLRGVTEMPANNLTVVFERR